MEQLTPTPTLTPTSIDNVRPHFQLIGYANKFPVYSTFCKYLLPAIIFFIISVTSLFVMILSCLVKGYDPTNTKTSISYICFMFSIFAGGHYTHKFISSNFRIPIYRKTNLNPNEI